MNISLPPKNYAEALLKSVPEFGNKEYLDMASAIDAVKNNTMDWQPYFSVASYTYALLEDVSRVPDVGGNYKITDGDKSLRRSVADSVLPTLVEFVKGVESTLDNSPYDEEMSRLLFHVRLALGSLYLAKGELPSAVNVLTEAIETPYNVEHRRVNIWGQIDKRWWLQKEGINVPITGDIVAGKVIIASEMRALFLVTFNHERMFYFYYHVALVLPSELIFADLERLVGLWVPQIIMFNEATVQFIIKDPCWINVIEERYDVHGISALLLKDWSPVEQWELLFHCLANILIACKEEGGIGEEITSPDKCELSSPNNWAWRLGWIVAIMWHNEEYQLIDDLLESSKPGIESWKSGLPLLSLIAECDDNRDWKYAREHYLHGWREHATRSVHKAFMEGPDSGVYWAMRVGLADGFIDPIIIQKGNQVTTHEPDDDLGQQSRIGLASQSGTPFEVSLNPMAPADIDRVLAAKHTEMMFLEIAEGMKKTQADLEKLKDKSEPTYFRTKEKLIGDYGDWVNQLTDSGALFDAEFLFETLNQRNWGVAVMGYANAAEAEVREAIIKPLRDFLLTKTKNDLVSIGSELIHVRDKMTLYDLEKVLCSLKENSLLKEFTQMLGLEREFVENELPGAISRLRGFHKGAAHGDQIAEAKEIRRLVLGTRQKPGILKALIMIRNRSRL